MRMTPLGGHSPYDHHVRSAVHRNHPLVTQIMKHSAALSEEANGLPSGSPARKKLDRRITELEQY